MISPVVAGLLASLLAACDPQGGKGDDSGAADGGGSDGGTLDGGGTDGGGTPDGGGTDAGGTDAGGTDAGGTDAGGTDAGGTDAGGTDGGGTDGGTDGGGTDASCALVSDLAHPYLWEGQTLAFAVECSGDLATEDAEISLVSAPDGATWDPHTRRLRWTTGPADGGRHDLVFSSRPAGATSIPEATTVTAWVADDPDLALAVPVDPLAYTEEWGLPVLHLQTTGPLTTSERKATVTWMGTPYSSLAKIRGASSASYAKPGYTLDFPDDELPIEPWGVERDHLVLLSPFDDNSYVRQKLIYDQWAAICEWSGEPRLVPRTFFLVLYLDGAYHGLYIGLDRVDDEFVRQMGFDGEGNLYKAVDHDANFYLTDSGGRAKGTLHQGYEKKEGLPEGDMSDLDALVSFTGGSDTDTLLAQAEDWFALEEFMDWFLLVHYAHGEDSAGKNSYLYHDPESGLWSYAPWDFNHSWGQNWYTLRVSSDAINTFTGTNRVFAALQADPETEALLWERFAAMREDGPFDPDWLLGQVDAYQAEIDLSARRDWDKWEDDYRSAWWADYRRGTWTDYEGELEYVRTWIEERDALFRELVP
ncbi:CotH kinase family protein [Myxococcota bacterium]|nr:CotH kinase family protein [Myxococcota bacterium]